MSVKEPDEMSTRKRHGLVEFLVSGIWFFRPIKDQGSRMIKNRTNLAIALSVLIHIVLALVLWLQPKFTPPRKVQTEVELLTPEQLAQMLKPTPHERGQVVDQSEKDLNDEIPDKTKFVSRHNQVVQRQTVAAVHGRFENTDAMGGRPQQDQRIGKTAEAQKPQVAKKERPRQVVTNENGLPVHPTLKDLTPSFKPQPTAENFAADGGRGPSATDDHITDVPKGMQTLLSTREFVYFAYYERIKNKLRQYWEPKIKEKMRKAMSEGRTIASTSDRVTKVIIFLDAKGTLVKVQVLDGSGVRDLDDAAVEAFRQAAPFPNPPKGIIDPDGFVKINWDFILEA